MTTPWRVALGAVLGGLLAVAGWRILAHGVADARVGEDPAGALHWVSGHPEALRTLAEQQFDAGQRLGNCSVASHWKARPGGSWARSPRPRPIRRARPRPMPRRSS